MMRDYLLLVALVVALGIYVMSRVRVLEEKILLLKRSADRQLSEADVEHVLKCVREGAADALEQRLKALEAQADEHSARLSAVPTTPSKKEAVATSGASG